MIFLHGLQVLQEVAEKAVLWVQVSSAIIFVLSTAAFVAYLVATIQTMCDDETFVRGSAAQARVLLAAIVVQVSQTT